MEKILRYSIYTTKDESGCEIHNSKIETSFFQKKFWFRLGGLLEAILVLQSVRFEIGE